ncbi:solute carrier family 46 member 3-like isoform X2 [Uloborus diversus]|uniref:solute carrier family 46 member 3-like isoform X2 n=1 Tax=Uloborus diversus TaxID=327109 RepID=UPI00240A75C2|nr:solute carrier family 46 member 3-like isoform X2 [Uloborus diversus]
MTSETSVKFNSSDYLYQGSSDDPPVPLHFEGTASTEIRPTWTDTAKSKLARIGSPFKKVRLEIVAFLFVFSYTMTRISSTTMIIDKVCLAHFKFPEEVCKNLHNFTHAKSSVEKLATNYQLGHTLIQTAPAALLACFVGPWSDHYGRKFPTLLAVFGMVLDTAGSVVCAYYLNSRVEYYFIPAFFTGAFGGVVSLLAVVYSYASDLTAYENRTMKYAFIEMASGFAIPFGAMAGGWIYEFFGYAPVFFFSAAGLLFSFFWVLFLLPETRGIGNTDPWSVKIKNLFSCKSFKESFIATAKKRPHNGRLQIVLLILSMCFLVITINSTGDINYLYVHHQFNWGNSTYSTITAIYSVFAILLLLIVVPLMKYFKTGDPTLGLIGTVSLLGKNIGVGLAYKPGIYHFAFLDFWVLAQP